MSDANRKFTPAEERMIAKDPELYAKACKACENIGHRSIRVRKSGNATKGTYVTGPVKTARPAYFKETKAKRSVVFEAVIETQSPTTDDLFYHTVLITKLP